MHQAPCAPFFFAHRQARGKGPSETLKGVDGPFPLPAARRRPHPNRQPFAGGAADTAVAGWVGRSPREGWGLALFRRRFLSRSCGGGQPRVGGWVARTTVVEGPLGFGRTVSWRPDLEAVAVVRQLAPAACLPQQGDLLAERALRLPPGAGVLDCPVWALTARRHRAQPHPVGLCIHDVALAAACHPLF